MLKFYCKWCKKQCDEGKFCSNCGMKLSRSTASTQLEEDFIRISSEIQDKITAKLDEAKAALDEACRLSDESGIAFSSSISAISQAYVPQSFTSKFKNIDIEFVANVLDVSSYDLQESYRYGWAHSQIC